MAIATANQATLKNIQSTLQAMTGLAAVIGEPTDPPANVTVAIIPEGGSIDETTLQSPRELHRLLLVFMVPDFREPKENTEFDLDMWRAQVMSDVFGDFDLGGNVAYAEPTQFAWVYGYRTIATTRFRTLDLTVVYRLDDNATFVI